MGPPSLESLGISSESLASDAPMAPLPPSGSGGIKLDPKVIMMIAAGTALLAVIATIAYVLTLLMPSSNPPLPPVASPGRPTVPPTVTTPSAPSTPSNVAMAPASPDVPAPAPRIPAYAKLTPVPPKDDEKKPPLTEEAIDLAIKRGVDFLLSQFDKTDHLIKSNGGQGMQEGTTALALLALLHSEKSSNDPRLRPSTLFMRDAIEGLKKMSMNDSLATYTRSLRLQVLSLAGRPQDRTAMLDDVKWLMQSSVEGAYTYGMPPQGAIPGNINCDNSNSQYGVLGVWAAAEVGIGVSPSFWTAVEKYWLAKQSKDGGWDYTAGNGASTTAMTAAGLTSLFLSTQQPGARDGVRGIDTAREALTRGTKWLANGNNLSALNPQFPGYTLYGIERVGLASGMRFFGDKDWFLTLAPGVISTQREDGSWPVDSVIDTSFHLLFLSRGSHPILMTKLEFGGNWNNKPSDLVNLTRFAGPNTERDFNWQSVPISQPFQNWTGSPVLYIASDKAPDIDENGLNKIKQFIEHGGLLFANADKNSAEFTKWVEETAKKLFPDYEMKDVPPNHPVFSVAGVIQNPPPLRMLTNGTRVLIFLSPTDVAATWDRRATKDKLDGFRLGVNIAVYATGLSPFRSRLQSIYESGSQRVASGAFPVVRVRYKGNWNAEPATFPNFGRWMTSNAGIDVKGFAGDPAALDPFDHPIAYLSGSGKCTPPDSDVAALQKYVTKGGILLVDPIGSSVEFSESALSVVQRIAGQAPSGPLLPDHPLLQLAKEWPALPAPAVRVAIGGRDNSDPAPTIYAVGDGYVIVMERDLGNGLLGSNVWNLHGYTIDWSRNFTEHLIVATIQRAKTKYGVN